MERTDTKGLFQHLPQDVQAKLRTILHPHSFKAGERVFNQGAPPAAIYLVLHGQVKLTHVTPEGYESGLCLREPGDWFCLFSALEGRAQLCSAAVLTDGNVLWADRAEFCALCEAHPDLLAWVQRTCLEEVCVLLHRLEGFAFRSVKERLALALLDESRRRQTSGEPLDELRLTQQELASQVGASREYISRLLAHLKRDGVVALKRGRVIICNRDKLTQVAGVWPRPPGATIRTTLKGA